MLPEPTVRADGVDHYGELLAADGWPSEAMCLTVVRGLSVEDALIRFDGMATGREATLVDAGRASVTAFPDELPLVVADDLDGWVVLVEDNGYHGADPAVLSRLSGSTVAASAYWNVNLATQLSLAHDGEVLGAFDFVSDEPPTEGVIEPFIRSLDFADPERMFASALAFLERVSGVRVPFDWASHLHPASVVAGFQWLALPGADGWLEINAPELHAALSTAGGPEVRAVTTLAAVSACEAAGVDDPALLDSLTEDVDALPAAERADLRERLARRTREEYRQALHLRWDRCRPLDLDPIAALQSEVSRRNADRSTEYGLVARAHAMATTHSRLLDDPRLGLALAVANACQIDKAGWPAFRDRLTQALSSL